MQQAQTDSNGTVPVFTADEGNDSLAAMMTRALDEWNVIQYYQQLLELEHIESADSIALLTDCYLKLSEPHRDELELTLRAMHKLISTISKGT
ncbi:hypothetical protein [Nostoc sp.]|uniref:hypothetical protein n=1 Tax=Nostoc sp. TaxID=1180 RepID=UPI002FFD0ABB